MKTPHLAGKVRRTACALDIQPPATYLHICILLNWCITEPDHQLLHTVSRFGKVSLVKDLDLG